MRIRYLVLIFAVFCPWAAFAAEFDIAALCEDAAEQDARTAFFKVWETDLPLTQSWSGDQIALWVSLKPAGIQSISTPWILLSSPKPEPLRAAQLLQFFFAEKLIAQHEPDQGLTLRSLFEREANEVRPYKGHDLSEINAIYSDFDSTPLNPQIKDARGAAPFVCAPYADLFCTFALNRVLDLMASRGYPGRKNKNTFGSIVSLPDVVFRLMTDARLKSGLAHAALRELSRTELGRVDPDASVFEDLRTSFRHVGFSTEEALEAAWDVMGFYGTRGASLTINAPLFQRANYPVLAALHVIAVNFGPWDLIRHKSLNPTYSMGARVNSRCIHGRPYHFWMAAYLAHRLQQEGFSRNTILNAVHIAGVAYEFAADVFGKDHDTPIRLPLYSPENNSIRENIVFNDTGALWALSGDAELPPIIPFDLGLKTVLKHSRPLPPMSAEDLKNGMKNLVIRWLWWNQVIAPNSHLSLWRDYLPLKF